MSQIANFSHSTDEDWNVYRWQVQQLQHLGLPEIRAELLAGLVDHHELEHLLAQGCDEALAVDILT